jgi:hypothetical protein
MKTKDVFNDKELAMIPLGIEQEVSGFIYRSSYVNDANQTVFDRQYKVFRISWDFIGLNDKYYFRLETENGIYGVYTHSPDDTLVTMQEMRKLKLKEVFDADNA